MRTLVGSSLGIVLLLLFGCDGPVEPDDTGTPRVDAPSVDTGAVDTGTTPADGGLDAPAMADAPEATDAPVPDDAPVPVDAFVPSYRILVVGSLDAGRGGAGFATLLGTWGTVTAMADPTLSATLLAAYDLVIFGDMSNSLTAPERNALTTWMGTAEGRMLVLAGYNVTDRPETQSITSCLGIDVDRTRTTFPISGTAWVPDSEIRGALTGAPAVNGSYVFENLGDGGEREIVTTVDTVGARWEGSIALSGRAFLFGDEQAVIDADWDADSIALWNAVIGWLVEGV